MSNRFSRSMLMVLVMLTGLMSLSATIARAQSYPPLEQYLMPRDAEVALARTAAPAHISGKATIKVLTSTGFQVVQAGENGFVCMVMRGWAAPTYTPAPFRNLVYDPSVRAPICFNPDAARAVAPYYELRSKLGMAGKSPDEITAAVEAAYARGELPKRDAVSFAYMFSAEQHLGPGIGHWHPHMMIFAPYTTNHGLGDNDYTKPLPAPFVSDDEGTPFTVVVVPVDENLAIKK